MRASLLAATLLAASLLGGTAARAEPDNFTEVERGRYLTTAGDCMACHISNDGRSMAGGHRLETPFGAIAVPNLTPDEDTGIGKWTSDEFWRAMHEGRGASGERLYPAFPYTAFTKMPRQDVDAIYAYLRKLEPVRNRVDRDTLPFPFNIRLLMAGWNLLNFTPGEFRPDPAKSEEFNRGAYLVEGPGHCGLCHTARNLIGGDASGTPLRGGLLQGWYAPNITADKRQGIGDWSDQEMIDYLRTGRNVRATASGPMAEVVAYSTANMTEADLKAIAVFLRESAAAGDPAPAPLPATDAKMVAGTSVFQDSCSACHVGNGAGVPGMFPRLSNNQVVQQTDPTTVIRVILDGVQSVATPTAPTAPAMPAFHWRMTDQQVADVSTFIRNSWGNAAPAVTVEQVRKMREQLGDRRD